jgi:hypothetical protein
MGRRRAGGLVGLAAASLLCASHAHAYYLDAKRNFNVRTRAYAQAMVFADDSSGDTTPSFKAGDVLGQRNFYNPEFDARLTDYTGWMAGVPGAQWLRPDEFKFRFAWWGFYDGVYDYGASQYASSIRTLRTRFSESDDPRQESYSFNDQHKQPRPIYGHRNRINELYLDYTKGRAFFRIGRQAISWGESDTIALLDANNPFDITQGAPGFFQDLDEARIPLWTARTTWKLFDVLGPFSGGFIDAYLVPGNIDATTPITPILTASPYSVPGGDPQVLADALSPFPGVTQLVQVDHIPDTKFGNSRWGVRLQGIIAREYTTSIWYYRTFPNAPVPLLLPPGAPTSRDPGVPLGPSGACSSNPPPSGRSCMAVVAETFHDLVGVAGIATTFYNAYLNGIIRAEVEAFIDEPSFIPEKNLNPRVQLPKAVFDIQGRRRPVNTVPRANYIRWTVGFDRFFFLRALNPSNSFVFVSSFNGQWNVNESRAQDFRYNGQSKPGQPQTIGDPLSCFVSLSNPNCIRVNSNGFVDLSQFDNMFFQTALQTDYLHGRLSPRLVNLFNLAGVYAVAPEVTYRFSDSLLFALRYMLVEGTFKQIGFFRDRDQFQFRVTYQLN